MRDDVQLRELLENKWVTNFQEWRNQVRRTSKGLYTENDIVAIKYIQLGLSLVNKYLCPYSIRKAWSNERPRYIYVRCKFM